MKICDFWEITKSDDKKEDAMSTASKVGIVIGVKLVCVAVFLVLTEGVSEL